ncbi:P-loop containing nucleoside triphosphate hydrolase protein [Gymnopilus junonius]|uniref:P-loop containing nucleoside triphosphate hydrolase protein n=1 Tax=Gymnopilus junonius TaxID=109634 RepID=A0A9P5NPF2_GYMJU|nr:P-loop containing nucleoside triphosphate hydrolase protein [Gymnopilus junonius]
MILRWTTLTRGYSSTTKGPPIISIPPGSNIYAFGAPSHTRTPLLSHLAWTVNEGEAWAVVSGSGSGGGGKSAIFKTLLGHTRISPPTHEMQGRWAESGGLYPFLSHPTIDPYTRISFVSFRQRTGGGDAGAFFDYTARYGAMREEEDKITVRDTLSAAAGGEHDQRLFDELTERIGLKPLLDLPLITLSNGQTRRARVVRAILDRPEVLLLDEPLTGLDPPSRKALTETLQRLHSEKSPRIIIGLRKGEEVPSWITHVLEIEGGTARTWEASEFSPQLPWRLKFEIESSTPPPTQRQSEGALLVDMRDVNVAYGDRKVLTNINWQIRQGERWHLQGANGSGKTTLLSLLTGDHPQSYTQAHLLLPSHRKRTPTPHLRQLIGVVSPEMFDAFPRRHPGMSVWEAVTTGFDGGDEEDGRGWVRVWRVGRCWEVLNGLGPAAWSRSAFSTAQSTSASTSTPIITPLTQEFAQTPFSSLPPGTQRLVLLMRALVGRPPVVLLDEVWSGMDEDQVRAARGYLRGEGVGEDQAVVVITHWEDEVPWVEGEVRRFKL